MYFVPHTPLASFVHLLIHTGRQEGILTKIQQEQNSFLLVKTGNFLLLNWNTYSLKLDRFFPDIHLILVFDKQTSF